MKLNVTDIKNKALPILKKAGVTRSSLFGSIVRGENTKDSDIDILVDLPKRKSLFDLVDLQIKLKETFGRNIDVITYKSLHPLLKDSILKEQIKIL